MQEKRPALSVAHLTSNLLAGMLLFAASVAYAEGQYIDILPKSAAEIQIVLDAVEEQLAMPEEQIPPITMMLHGREAKRFLKSEYLNNRSLVDKSAQLSALGLIDVKICETWLRRNRHELTELFPFISPVPFGADELDRLVEEEAYTEFEVDL